MYRLVSGAQMKQKITTAYIPSRYDLPIVMCSVPDNWSCRDTNTLDDAASSLRTRQPNLHTNPITRMQRMRMIPYAAMWPVS
jgi:hypothetical protein